MNIKNINSKNINLTIIVLLMIVSGCIIYFMYLIPEAFESTQPATPTATLTATPTTGTNTTQPTYCPCVTSPEITPKAIVSRYFGVGFNVYALNNNSSNVLQNKLFLIEHIPITTTGTAGGMYSLSSDGKLTIKIKNNDDPSQWWDMSSFTDSSDNSNYVVMRPNGNSNMALQYANGNLSLRPFSNKGYEGQKWLKSQDIVTRGIPVLNYSPGSMFTTEFDPYSTSSSINTNNLSDSHNKQVTDVINSVKSGIQQYLSQTSSSQQSGQSSKSSLGNKELPLNVNLNLGGSNKGVSYFDNVSGSTSDQDILEILDRYQAGSSASDTLYSKNDLMEQIQTASNGCKLFNTNDYTSSRVSTCNCKI